MVIIFTNLRRIFIWRFVERHVIQTSITVIDFLLLLCHFHFFFSCQVHAVRHVHDEIFIFIFPRFQLQTKKCWSIVIFSPRRVGNEHWRHTDFGPSTGSNCCSMLGTVRLFAIANAVSSSASYSTENFWRSRLSADSMSSWKLLLSSLVYVDKNESRLWPSDGVRLLAFDALLRLVWPDILDSGVSEPSAFSCGVSNVAGLLAVNQSECKKWTSSSDTNEFIHGRSNTYHLIDLLASFHYISHTILSILSHHSSPLPPSIDSVLSIFPNRGKNPSG